MFKAVLLETDNENFSSKLKTLVVKRHLKVLYERTIAMSHHPRQMQERAK